MYIISISMYVYINMYIDVYVYTLPGNYWLRLMNAAASVTTHLNFCTNCSQTLVRTLSSPLKLHSDFAGFWGQEIAYQCSSEASLAPGLASMKVLRLWIASLCHICGGGLCSFVAGVSEMRHNKCRFWPSPHRLKLKHLLRWEMLRKMW